MKPFIKDYFSFNRRERNGIIVLLGIIIILILYLSLSKYFVHKQKVDFSEFEKEVDDFVASQNLTDTSVGLRRDNLSANASNPDNEGPTEFFNFNPNNLSEEEWRQLGLKDWQIKAIEKYRAKAGDFYTKEDFKKLSVISDEQYKQLEPYIKLPEENGSASLTTERISQKQQANSTMASKETSRTLGASRYDKPKIEINSTDTFELKKLKGIGSVYANRIIEYGHLIGGYYKKEQLLEVYGIDTSLFELISGYIDVDGTKIRKININYCTANQLNQHPYITKNVAAAIVNYRDRHGKYTNIADIRKIDLVKDELYFSIVPYLTIE